MGIDIDWLYLEHNLSFIWGDNSYVKNTWYDCNKIKKINKKKKEKRGNKKQQMREYWD